MKALSLKQPFAELILQGRKTIEIRKWNTHFRGEFLIHASKTPDKESMKKFGYKELLTGQILGKAVLVEVIKYKNLDEFLKDKDKHFASTKWGMYGFVLESPKRITPISCKGKLNFWEFKE